MTTFALTEKLLRVADTIAADRTVQVSDAALRQWREEVRFERSRVVPQDMLIDYEATCLVECLAALAYARTEKDRDREGRALCYINSLRVFMRNDLARARKGGAA